MSTPTSRSVDNYSNLTNTCLGLEQDRAFTSEHAIQANLDSYIASNNTAVASAAATVASNSAASTASLNSINSTIASIQALQVTDENRSATQLASLIGSLNGETNRAGSAEQALTTSVATNTGAISTNSSAIASNLTAINALIASRSTDETNVASLIASRTADEATIASLVASRTSDEAHITQLSQTTTSLHGSQITDEANIATNTASIASINAALTTESTQITALQNSFTALTTTVSTSTLAVSGAVTAGSVNTSLIENDTGVLALVATHAQYGTSRLILSNTGGSNGFTMDNSASPIEVAEMVLKTSTSTAKLSFNKMPGSEIDPSNAPNGEFHISTNDLCMYVGTASSGLTEGNFKVLNGYISDANDLDITLRGTWGNFNQTQANMRFVRKGSQVTVSLSPFNASAQSNTDGAMYSMPIPVWASPAATVCCTIVVSVNSLRSIGCCALSAENCFTLIPLTGNWKNTGGLTDVTTFSYLV